MPEKYIRRQGVPILLRHTGSTTLPERAPFSGKSAAARASAAPPVVLCLHDAGLQSSVFKDLLIALEGIGLDALAFDLPGHGRSGSLDALPSIGAMTEVAQWVAEWCALERIVLLGHGMGALVALDWARRASDRIDGLVLCGAGAALATDEQAIEEMRRVKNGKAPRPFDPGRVCKTSGPEMMRRAYMEGIGTDPRATLGDLEAVRQWTKTLDEEGYDAQAPGAFRGRVLLAEGESAPLEQRDLAARWFTPVGACSSVLIPGASHFLPLERPAPFAAALRRFVVPPSHTPALTLGERKTKGPS